MKTLLKSTKIPSTCSITAPCEITLHEWGLGEWVTHLHNLQDNGYYYGHYFNDIVEAEADYEARVQRYR